MAIINVVKKVKKEEIGIGSVVTKYNELHMVVKDKKEEAYRLLNLKTGTLVSGIYHNTQDMIEDSKLELITNEVDIVLRNI